MATDLVALFSKDGGERAYQKRIAALIRAEKLDEAEEALLEDLRQFASELSSACQSLTVEGITIAGWDEIDPFLAVPFRSRGNLCTAVGIDISNCADLAADENGWTEPGIETAFYDDGSFPFSTSTRAGILAGNEEYCPKWQGSFEEIEHMLSIKGMSQLNTMLQTQLWKERPSTPEAKANYAVADLFRALRFQQVIQREVEANGLLLAVPVIVGSNSCGPFLESVYYAKAAPGRREAAVQNLAAKRRAAREEYDRHTQEQVEFFRKMRADILGWSWFVNRKQRQTHIEFCESYEALHMKDYQPPPQKSFWKLSDSEFEAYLQRYQRARASE